MFQLQIMGSSTYILCHIHCVKMGDKLEFAHGFEFEVTTEHHLFSRRDKTQNNGKTQRYTFQGKLGK